MLKTSLLESFKEMQTTFEEKPYEYKDIDLYRDLGDDGLHVKNMSYEQISMAKKLQKSNKVEFGDNGIVKRLLTKVKKEKAPVVKQEQISMF